MDIKLELEYTSSEIKRALNQYYLWSIKKYQTLLLTVLGIGLVLTIVAGAWAHLFLLIIGLPLIFVYFFFVLPNIFISKNNMYQATVSLKLKSDKIEIESKDYSASYSWEHFERAFETDEFILLGDKREPKIIIPKRILNINEIEELRTKLNANKT